MGRRLVLFFLFLILFSGSACAVIKQDSMKVFAVTENGEKAMTADLSLEIESGTGRVWTSVEPLIGTSTQTTERTAVRIAKNYFDRVDSFDYKFSIKSNASLVDGPSAGAAMTLLTVSMLTDRDIPDNVGMTGTITNEGSVGQVGGVFKKAEEAARIGIKLFMIPVGEAKQIVKTDSGVESVNLVDYAEKNWGMKVVEVKDIDVVLQLAFSDIEQIDTNTINPVFPEFIPNAMAYSPALEKMHVLTQGYIDSADEKVQNARASLTGTLISDPGIIDVMLASLNSAEDSLQKAKLLYDQNYLYSSANYAFLAKVNAGFVDDISSNPSLIDPSSTFLDLKILELTRQMEQLKNELSGFIPLEEWEWHAAAMQRLSWAEFELNSISSEEVIVIDIGDVSAGSLEAVLSYEYAQAWKEAAIDFYELSKASSKKIVSREIFSEEINDYISKAEKNLESIAPENTSDISRRLETAKTEKERNWGIASLFDSASAFGLSQAELFISDKSLEELETALKEKIFGLESEISGKNLVWARLYLDHAKYYSKGTDFYKEQGLNANAKEMAESGIALVFMAEEVFNSSEKASEYLSQIPESELLDNIPVYAPLSDNSNSLVVLLLSSAIILIVVFFLAYFYAGTRGGKGIDAVEKAGARLDRLFAEQKISHREYAEAHAILENRIAELHKDRNSLSRSTVEIDRMRFESQALQKTLLELKRQRKNKIVTKKDFENNVKDISKRMDALKKEIVLHRKDIEMEKKRISQDLEKYSKEAKSLLNPKKKTGPQKKPAAKKK